MAKLFSHCFLGGRKVVEKGWGGTTIDGRKIGEVFVYHNPVVEGFPVGTVKLLFIEQSKKLSLHFHIQKTEIFYCVCGEVEVTLIKDGETKIVTMKQHDAMIILPGMIHSMCGIGEQNILLEVSTLDYSCDSYRISKGD